MTYPNATHVSPNFTWAEVKMDPLTAPPAHKAAMVRHANKVLEPIRAHFGKPVHITEEGGYRTLAQQTAIWNNRVAQVGVAKARATVARPGSSRHEKADATDIWINGVTPSQIAAFAATLPDVGGIGIYASFAHVDSRRRSGGVIARW